MFRKLFHHNPAKLPKNEVADKEIVTIPEKASHSVQCYLVLQQLIGDFDVNSVFNGSKDERFNNDLDLFNRLCEIHSTWEEARESGRLLVANRYGIFEVGYPVAIIRALVTRGLLSQIILGGWQSPSFNKEQYVENPNFNDSLLQANSNAEVTSATSQTS